MSEARSHRVFFALWPDDEAASHLSALAQELAGRSGGRITSPAAMHLTLAFVGRVVPVTLEALIAIAGTVEAGPFQICLDRLGFWPRQGILWAGCRSRDGRIDALAGELRRRLGEAGIFIDPRPQVPHVTLARRARCAALPRLGTPIAWPVHEFALVESHLHPSGARYRTLATFPLGNPDRPG